MAYVQNNESSFISHIDTGILSQKPQLLALFTSQLIHASSHSGLISQAESNIQDRKLPVTKMARILNGQLNKKLRWPNTDLVYNEDITGAAMSYISMAPWMLRDRKVLKFIFFQLEWTL